MQRVRRLVGRRAVRRAEGCFVVEGVKVLAEALEAGASVESVYVDPDEAGPAEQAAVERCLEAGSRVFEVESGVVARVAGTVNPQPILAVVNAAARSLADLAAVPSLDFVVVCADVRDPGNAGTVLRSAAASGAQAVIFCDGSVDPFNPKTVRASAGAVFHVPVVDGGPATAALAELGGRGLWRWATVARDGVEYTEADLRRPCAIVMGNEASGLAPGTAAATDGALTIPMHGPAESLNVGMAAAVVCFEAARQRRSTGDRLTAPAGPR